MYQCLSRTTVPAATTAIPIAHTAPWSGHAVSTSCRLAHVGGGEIVGGTTLFQLIRHDRAAALYEHLGRRGILTRAFAENPAWLRFGLPAPKAFARLESALAAFA